MLKYAVAGFNHYWAGYKGLPGICWQAIILRFFNAISVGVCYFLALYLTNDLHFDIARVGIMMSSYGFGTVLGGMTSGRLCDRVSARIIAAICLFIQSFSFFLLTEIKTLEGFILNLFFLGFASYGFQTANDIRMLSLCNNNEYMRLKSINVSHVASNLGLGLSGILIGLMAGYGYVCIFYSASLLLFLSACYLINQSEHVSPVEKPANQSVTDNIKMKNQLLLVIVLMMVFSVGLITAQLSSTYPVYLIESFPKLGAKAVSILFLLDTVLIVIFQTAIANFYKDYNNFVIMGVGACLMGAGMYVLSISSVFSVAVISCIIWTSGEMLFAPISQLVCYENGAANKKGASMGWYRSVFAASMVIGPMIGGFVYRDINPDAIWHISAIIGLVCLFICFLLAFKRR